MINMVSMKKDNPNYKKFWAKGTPTTFYSIHRDSFRIEPRGYWVRSNHINFLKTMG